MTSSLSSQRSSYLELIPPITATEEERESLDDDIKERLEKRRADTAGVLANTNIAPNDMDAWTPLAGGQDCFLATGRVKRQLREPVCYEVLFSGERGPGKTDALLMAFGMYVGKGLGRDWRGIIFRRTYPELADIIEKSLHWFNGKGQYNQQKSMWRFHTGETLLFRNFQKASDYWSYHGHAYPFIGWEELTNWPDDACYKSMFSCSRSTNPNVPIMLRATTNPYGVGHGWVKYRFRLEGWPRPQAVRTPIIQDAVDDDGIPEPKRMTVFGRLKENTVLLRADPNYIQRISASASNDAMLEAWLSGSWDVISGGMFEHCWDRNTHIVEPFEIPSSWRIDLSYDYGATSPFAFLWVAESDGTDYLDSQGKWHSTVRGDLFVIREYYGWNGKPNKGLPELTMKEVAKQVTERQITWGLQGKVQAGPADTKIFDHAHGTSLYNDLSATVRLDDGKTYPGLRFVRANKKKHSRALGWKKMIEMFEAAKQRPGFAREYPGLFVFGKYCPQFLRTVPNLPRHEVDLDDVNSDAEDHLGDTIRYRVLASGAVAKTGSTTGGY